MAVNAQGSGSDALGIRTIINMVEDCCPQWAVLFLSESDWKAPMTLLIFLRISLGDTGLDMVAAHYAGS